jgi:putative transposase
MIRPSSASLSPLAECDPAGPHELATSLRDEEALRALLDWENEQTWSRFPSTEAPAQPGGGLSLEAAQDTVPANKTGRAAIVSWYQQRKGSLEETVLELYHGNISIAGIERVVGQLWGGHVGIESIVRHSRILTERIGQWLRRPIEEPQVYVYLHSIQLGQKLPDGRRVDTLLAAVGVCASGRREILAVTHQPGASQPDWGVVVSGLKQRGLRGTRLFVGDNNVRTCAAVLQAFPKARYQGFLAGLEREVLAAVSPAQSLMVLSAFERMQASPSEESAQAEMAVLARRLKREGVAAAARLVTEAESFAFANLNFPAEHRARLVDCGPLETELRTFRERVRLVGPVPDAEAQVLLLAARLRDAARGAWSRRRFIRFAA